MGTGLQSMLKSSTEAQKRLLVPQSSTHSAIFRHLFLASLKIDERMKFYSPGKHPGGHMVSPAYFIQN